MAERAAVVFLLLAGAAVAQRGELRNMSVRDKFGMVALLAPLAYVSAIFVLQADWPRWSDLLRFVFGPPSERLFGLLKEAV